MTKSIQFGSKFQIMAQYLIQFEIKVVKTVVYQNR